MISIDEEKIQKLRNGDFSDARIDYWFVNHAFDYIFAIIDGCDKNSDFAMLNFVSIYAQQLMKEPNARDLEYGTLKETIMANGFYPATINTMNHEELITYWNATIVKTCERILQKVIIVGHRHSEVFYPILKPLMNHPNDKLRLCFCANGSYVNFLYDRCPRVRKVAHIRYNFDKRWNEMGYERQRIQFLAAALEKNVIQCIDACSSSKETEKVYAMFSSLLFTNEAWLPEFDRDIFSTISDKRILADALNELILEGKLSLRDGMVPICFDEPQKEYVLAPKQEKQVIVC